jgi:uncharacterized membrane protein
LFYYVYLRSASRLVMYVTIAVKNDVQGVFINSYLLEGSCLIYVICLWMGIVMSNTYSVVFLFCFSSSCITCIASFIGMSIFYYPFGIVLRLFPPISTKRNENLTPLVIEHKRDHDNIGLWKSRSCLGTGIKCGGVRLINGI